MLPLGHCRRLSLGNERLISVRQPCKFFLCLTAPERRAVISLAPQLEHRTTSAPPRKSCRAGLVRVPLPANGSSGLDVVAFSGFADSPIPGIESVQSIWGDALICCDICDQPCLGCDGWWANIREAFVKAASYQERCQLLTLVPKGVATREVERLIPEASKYLLKKSKQLRERFGVWERPEPYHGGSISEDTIRAATQYYTDDDLDCSRQSPNKKDAVKLLKDGEEHVVVKRYMTRSVRETYRLFKEANPDSKLGLTKFYSLRPKPETDLVFNADEPDTNKHIGSVVLTNTSDTHVAFKIKTNNIDGYKVKPFFGIIPLNSTVSVNVAQNPGSEFHASDKLLIMTTGIDTLEITPRELIDHWRAVAKESIKEHRLRCVNPGLTTSKISPETKEQCLKSLPLTARQAALAKDKSYQSFCPPVQPSPTGTNQLGLIQDVVGDLQAKISPETKEQCLKSLPLTARQAALAKDKSYQSFCPPVQPSPTGTNQLGLIQDVVGDLQAKIGDVHQEVNKISKRQEHLVVCMGATLILLVGNLVVLFLVKSCQSAREWYC
ncbi:putative vesicle-associated membrane protein [Ixodes scapularis]